MKQVLAIVLKTVLVLAGLVVFLLVTHPLWIGPVAKGVAESKVPELTGTPFTLKGLHADLYAGALRLENATLFNPAGFDEPRAFELDRFSVDVDMASVLSDVVVVRDVTVDGLFVAFIGRDGTNNFEMIAAHAARAGEGGEKAAKKAEKAPTRADGTAAEDPGGEAGKKVVIDRLTLRNLTVRWMGVTIPVPTIVVRGIGRESGGVTWSVAGEEILVAVMRQLQTVSGGLLNFGAFLAETGTLTVSNSVREVSAALRTGAGEVAAATEKSAEAVTAALGGGAGELAGAATNAVNAVLNALQSGIETVEGGSSDAVKSAKDALKESRDALKNLFRRPKK